MDTLSQKIQNASELISLILVFTTVLFDVRYPQIRKDIGMDIPEGTIARKRYKHVLVSSLLLKSIPLFLINGVAFYLMLPSVVEILHTSYFSLWDFDFTRSAFLFVALFEFLFAAWSFYLSMKLLIRIYKVSIFSA